MNLEEMCEENAFLRQIAAAADCTRDRPSESHCTCPKVRDIAQVGGGFRWSL